MVYLLYFLTSLLYIISFPNFNFSWLAWICLIPFLIAVDSEKEIRSAIRNSFLCGWVIYLGSMHWLTKVSWLGYILVTLYLACYFALFGIVRFHNKNFIIIPVAWTALEFIRSNLWGGIPWLLLGASQYSFLSLIQIANVTAVYGVSFIVVLINASIVKSKYYVLLILLLVIGYGKYTISKTVEGEKIKIGVVQPNVPQDIKWDPVYTDWMVEKLEKLSYNIRDVNLIIWPETAVPTFTESASLFKRITLLAKELDTDIFIGSQGLSFNGEKHYHNSAFLVSKDGRIAGEYRKIHLVPFGEFVPFRKIFPFLKYLTPIEGEFTAGNEYTVFKPSNINHGSVVPLSTIICFEDIFPGLARKFVKRGADILVNITNDAWFGETNAVYQHAYLSIFRAVENGVPLVRATNTGLSCFIESTGKINVIKPFIEISSAREILVSKRNTFYTRYGDIFGWLCVIVLLGGLYVGRIKKEIG